MKIIINGFDNLLRQLAELKIPEETIMKIEKAKGFLYYDLIEDTFIDGIDIRVMASHESICSTICYSVTINKGLTA